MHLRYYKPDSNAAGVSVCVCLGRGGGKYQDALSNTGNMTRL